MLTSLSVCVVSLALFWMAAFTLWWQMHAWRTPETLASIRFEQPSGTGALSFSLLVPARHEQTVLEHTVTRLLESTHGRYEILVIVGHDDPETAEVAEKVAAAAPYQVRVITDTHEKKNKPKALNTALPHCRGEVVGVFDAEDQVHPALLSHVDHAFRTTGADVVQGGVQLINFHSSWYSLRNCLEYFFWFRSRLHLHAEKGFIPLGGNTVFVRTDVLREADGWDPECLAEDCDLGVRLSSKGKRVVVAYDSEMVTREETPGTLLSLLKQRTRWNQGFLQVYRKKDWRQLPTFAQRMLARYTLMTPFFQAFSGLVIPVNIAVALFLDVPVGVAVVSFLPAVTALVTFVFEVVGLHDFGAQYGLRVRFVHYLKLIAGGPFYQCLLAGAALRAVWREQRGRSDWELTRHVGAHLTREDVTS
ncbi:cellulose synthase/poly-beta-1,6-N-acetylglucosamine synthase-like glycosyltransferase [Streptomyces olivoverticillatus]|uniref:Cellulose synthase/poly-beta-1,6-N-acetylglucosamine synthase-like glycosyltransferase n=1 Tax=Streptomyces olivoverticillatus TaxID=66427 RepID=A0A7W7PIW8_9ACTN|nr:glycosyltransferase [Streptomyces olivoverticillatus]MBB4892521.1 cellulose synthase/poly-beta-1,6-N-acetylglucosamine synthase-like glycosyltransferase [Streptomyces olivoverticillatus]